MGTYNAASVLSLGKGPLSETGVDRLVASGEANATVKNGQVYVSPKRTAASTVYTPTRTASTAKAASTTTPRREGSGTFGSMGGFGGSLTTQTVKNDNHDLYHQAKQTAEPTKFSTGKLIEGIVRKGTTNAAHGMSSTLSWLEGALFAPAEALTGFDDLQEQHGLFYNWNSAIEKEREDAYRSSAANIKAGGTAAKIADTVGTGVVAALPQAVTAFMSAGASLGVVGAQGLEATAVAAQQSRAFSIRCGALLQDWRITQTTGRAFCARWARAMSRRWQTARARAKPRCTRWATGCSTRQLRWAEV